MRPVRTVARSALAAIFVIQGWDALVNPERLVKPAQKVADRLQADPKTLVRVNGAAQVAGGVLLATGRATTPGALLLAGSLVPTTYAGHPFWTVEDPAQRSAQRINFLKNVGLFGGLLFAALDKEGRPGLGWRARHAAHDARRTARVAMLATRARRKAGR
ncbi:DoxX family protein [Dactylosporangium sp. NPDC005572]|uniref:DoxX family protein n=1 Tax=Dactylosporangium sp. NPDC005572 TaxID=3156889 RepID=UPI0033BF3415